MNIRNGKMMRANEAFKWLVLFIIFYMKSFIMSLAFLGELFCHLLSSHHRGIFLMDQYFPFNFITLTWSFVQVQNSS